MEANTNEKRDLNFEVNNSVDLNKMLTGVLMDVRRGAIDHDTVKSITLVADKINKNNVKQKNNFLIFGL